MACYEIGESYRRLGCVIIMFRLLCQISRSVGPPSQLMQLGLDVQIDWTDVKGLKRTAKSEGSHYVLIRIVGSNHAIRMDNLIRGQKSVFDHEDDRIVDLRICRLLDYNIYR